jgi:hypothetical protein
MATTSPVTPECEHRVISKTTKVERDCANHRSKIALEKTPSSEDACSTQERCRYDKRLKVLREMLPAQPEEEVFPTPDHVKSPSEPDPWVQRPVTHMPRGSARQARSAHPLLGRDQRDESWPGTHCPGIFRCKKRWRGQRRCGSSTARRERQTNRVPSAGSLSHCDCEEGETFRRTFAPS